MNILELERLSWRMRKRILEMSLRSEGPTHLGGGLSLVEILAVLYGSVMNLRADDPKWEDRDRFILSKGHGVLGLYSVLAEVGIIDEATFRTFKMDGSHLIAHPVMNLDLGIEASNGSLGQGLSLAVGMAWAARRLQRKHNIFAVLGDGECSEGSIWEAAMLASNLKLENLRVVVDCNGLQSDGPTSDSLGCDSLFKKWQSFGWDTRLVDGHDVSDLLRVLSTPNPELPTCVIARTIKGKGINFMESNNEWHHNRLTQAMFEKASESLSSSAHADT